MTTDNQLITASGTSTVNKSSNYQGLTNRKRDRLRANIAMRAGGVVARFVDCAMGKIEMSPQAVRCGEVLLRKVLPDASPDSNISGQTLASILADIARSLPPNTQVGIAINNQHNQQVTQGTGLDIDPVEGKG